MGDLFDSGGRHAAIEMHASLYSMDGRNIGRYLKEHGVFVDLQGVYLGEIMDLNRLVYNRDSRYRQTNLGAQTRVINVNPHLDVARISAVTLPPGYEDVPREKLQ